MQWVRVLVICMLTCATLNAAETKRFTAKQLRLPGKKGACWTLREPGAKKGGTYDINMPKVLAVRPYWNYAWGNNFAPNQPRELEFVPMSWSGNRHTAQTLSKILAVKIEPAIRSGKVKRYLGFNEPDAKKQGNMTVEKALELWPSLERLGVPLASPACAKSRGDWMKSFMAEANRRKFRIDYLAIHHYGGASFKGFKIKMEALYTLYRRPLLITEMGVVDWTAKSRADNRFDQTKVLAFMKEALPWMEKQNWIMGYAWFPFPQTHVAGGSSALVDEAAKLTAVGRYYRSVTTKNHRGDQSIEIK